MAYNTDDFNKFWKTLLYFLEDYRATICNCEICEIFPVSIEGFKNGGLFELSDEDVEEYEAAMAHYNVVREKKLDACASPNC